MQVRPLWLMADPDRNPMFRRGWLDPPWPERKRPVPALTGNRPKSKTTKHCASDNNPLAGEGKARCRARAVAMALFRSTQ
jgi:hypothetical protein